MDYQSSMVNGDRTNIFIDKAKKQAKRLLKLSKQENNQLNIENLAQAQEILSQLNGYESWHSMMQSIEQPQPLG